MTMRSLLVLAGVVWVVSGCATARVRAAAAQALDCPETSVTVTEKSAHAWTASGCGKTTTCGLSKIEGAEPTCVRGIEKVE
jgi:hypothetical protein